MNNNDITSVVMLEAMWRSRRKDLLDLLSPFIDYAVASVTSPGSIIDINSVRTIIQERFGFNDFPSSVVIKVLNRNKSKYNKVKGDFYLIKSLDEDVGK